MTAPSSARDLVAESVVLVARAKRAVAASRELIDSHSALVAPLRRLVAAPARTRGYANLAAWNARKH